MSTDTVAVIVTILLAVGAAYAALSRRIDNGLARLGERLAHVEGIIQGWLNPLPPKVRDQEEAD
ncbi:MAG: hypothetical protein OXR82_08480 [Gammaproteobacteria bacterium]|nr:hypothetical protein [Gammaproteobacteria bacterium]MDE0258401.1 hypothetical protein [Gammaproteobacteria bacterium]